MSALAARTGDYDEAGWSPLLARLSGFGPRVRSWSPGTGIQFGVADGRASAVSVTADGTLLVQGYLPHEDAERLAGRRLDPSGWCLAELMRTAFERLHFHMLSRISGNFT